MAWVSEMYYSLCVFSVCVFVFFILMFDVISILKNVFAAKHILCLKDIYEGGQKSVIVVIGGLKELF